MLAESPIPPVHASLPEVRINVDSGPQAARQALDQLKRNLAPLSLDIEEFGAVELVLAEAMNNICEHAYAAGARSGPIRLRCQHRRDGLHFSIADEGMPMPGECTPLGLAVNVAVDLMDTPEGGFGWFLIRDLAKDVSYQRHGSVNHLSLRMAVAIG
ncbi:MULTISPECIES: ATP-binding protein [Roseobacteraceae]|jgi:serine/threonine-protein kinase RsbW|uniref:Serine-protein kinase RsbW n=1 Tax=Pseudosulfitobacter pseudonitzschiae TaxID=1402135 RepID=A0A221K4C9_9RHOB|nr:MULTISPECIES: ATP-binding protein [Roseobacteraceae]ASM73730.1 serine-protein kinase RsbW [Pseudosulfitobacter pseudonitzschiae]